MAAHEWDEDRAGGDRLPHDAREGRRYRSSWTQGPRPSLRADAYGRRSPDSGGGDGPHRAGAAHDEHERGHDDDYRRWRDEQMRSMDRDYDAWRRERFSADFAEWRAIHAAQAGLRTGSGPPITHADRERELRGPDWPERWDGGADKDGSKR